MKYSIEAELEETDMMIQEKTALLSKNNELLLFIRNMSINSMRKPKSRADSVETIATHNPILGYSENEPKKKRLKEEYSEYVWNSIKEGKRKSRSRSRKHVHIEDNHDSITIANLKNEYAHKQRYKHSYFKYKDDLSSTSPKKNEDSFSIRHEARSHAYLPPYEDRNSQHNRVHKARFSPEEENRYNNSYKREHSPALTYKSILPQDHESPLDRERKKKKLGEELQAQIDYKNNLKLKEKESKKNQDYGYLYQYIQHNPFGRMGAGAPLRDPEGHIVAHRLKMSDEVAATSFHKSFYHKQEEAAAKAHEDGLNHRNKAKIQNLNENEIGLQFLEWSNQERRRKDIQREEWKQELDAQSRYREQQKENQKRNKLEDDLRLEEKVKRDLQEMNEEYEKETGRKANKYANFSVGKESSVNYTVQNKRRPRRNGEHQKSQNKSSRGEDGSFDRMNDFRGLENEEDDTRSRIDAGYTNDVNIRNLRGDLKKRDNSFKDKLNEMKYKSTVQQAEIRNTLDSLTYLQLEIDQRNRDRKTSNSEFYNTLANENRSLLNSLRSNRRNTVNANYNYNKSFQGVTPNVYVTPYEQRFGVNSNTQNYPNVHHESVFVNAQVPQYSNHQSANDALDDLINSYQPTVEGSFTLPMPKSSMNHRNNEEYADQSYNDQIINVDDHEMGQMEDQNVEESYS